MKLKYIAMIFLLMWGLFSSCISEDRSMCRNLHVLDLSYMGDGTTEIFSQKIGKVQMLIFDETGQCVSRYFLNETELKYRHTLLPELSVGNYKIVCIANPYSTTIVADDGLSASYFTADAHYAGQTVSTNDSLYFSVVDYPIEPYSDLISEIHRTAHFKSSHYDVYVEVEGVPTTSTPSISMVGLSPYTDFANTAYGAVTEYQMETVHEESGLYVGKCCIMRHTDHTDVYMLVKDAQGNVLASVSLKKFLEDHVDQIDCSKNEVLIPIKLTFKSADVEVSMPGWEGTDITPGFGN
ncbi:MAG: FimB/Mfa2 family fimbrial subunit [Bacteroidales bacterium]|nr:FimB/Mfa2 family fimbrial subunit [Bacteroidales bacterium]